MYIWVRMCTCYMYLNVAISVYICHFLVLTREQLLIQLILNSDHSGLHQLGVLGITLTLTAASDFSIAHAKVENPASGKNTSKCVIAAPFAYHGAELDVWGSLLNVPISQWDAATIRIPSVMSAAQLPSYAISWTSTWFLEAALPSTCTMCDGLC